MPAHLSHSKHSLKLIYSSSSAIIANCASQFISLSLAYLNTVILNKLFWTTLVPLTLTLNKSKSCTLTGPGPVFEFARDLHSLHYCVTQIFIIHVFAAFNTITLCCLCSTELLIVQNIVRKGFLWSHSSNNRLQLKYFCMHLKAHKIVQQGVFSFFISCNFDDQLSRNFHRFVILCICWDSENTGLWQLLWQLPNMFLVPLN